MRMLITIYERAIEDYNKTIELDPNYAEAYNNRGNAYSGLKEYERAIEDYNKTIELDPNYAKAYTNRELARNKLKEQEGEP
jgi:tetratricopeptide (TPR) repeat protein